MRLRTLRLTAAFGLIASVGFAAEAFIAPTYFEPAVALPPPPADDSPAGLADLETVRQIHADLTPAQIARSQHVAHQSVFSLGASVLGPWFTAENLPRSATLLQQLTTECYQVVTVSKKHWQRPRPGVRDPALAPPGRNPGRSFSYPSGHATEAVVWVRILETAFPATRGDYAPAIREAAWGRVLSADHFPSDTQAGLVFGEEVATATLASPAMIDLLAALHAEAAPFQRD